MLVHKFNMKNKHKHCNDILDQPQQWIWITINKVPITQEAHTMNIYQLCGPQEHDDNDNVTSGECCAMSNFILPCVEEVTFFFSLPPPR